METLSFFANLGSLVGLAATLWTAWSAYRSKRYYLLVGRVPEQIRALRESTNRLATANNAPDRSRSTVLAALKHTRVAIESIRRNIGWKYRSDYSNLASKIRRVERSGTIDPRVVDDIWAEAEALSNQAESIVQDRKFIRGS